MVVPAKIKWFEFWQKLGLINGQAPYFAKLEASYSAPPRAYHNLAHIMDCLRELAAAKHLAQDGLAVEMAIWYHDVIYDSHDKDNEERSAAFAETVCKENQLPDPFTEKVIRLILATKKHDTSTDGDTSLMTDVDLSILGQAPQRFAEYEKQIRIEYGWVSDAAFADGRASVLENFLVRPQLYSTDFFRNKYEVQARENLTRSIQAWRITPAAGRLTSFP